MIRETLPERREARWLLAGVLLSSIGRGLTLPFLFIYLTDVRGLSDAAAGIAIGWFGAVVMVLPPADRGGTRPGRDRRVPPGVLRPRLPAPAVLRPATHDLRLRPDRGRLRRFSVRVADVSTRVVAWAMAASTIAIVGAQLVVMRRIEGRSRSHVLALVGVVFAVSWLVLGAGGLAGGQNPLLAAVLVIACAAIFGLGETLLQPVQPALINALAPDRLRGRYNSAHTINFGISSVVGPVTAGPLIGAGHAGVWVVLTLGGCLVASALALSLRGLLTPDQDGTPSPISGHR
ncbi:MFS transporter [Actinoplanes awajinensis]|uniref:Major facilitator superfamily (MFS) profile domain-containing protein n=1 Tax=Actinoplanes awajinensis subsp. mycoplanecinus TaxID=135947 RepID=A0A0X3V9W9_9ACTN|nr:MFS transporter [Actinoplanes awajinensis]KUL41593.1 hypothetical protein ADL15_04955 [Actinoplanes awajinensis subsp. mycoplanecinus]